MSRELWADERRELDKLRDAVCDIIAHHLETSVDDYRAADEIIQMLRPELLQEGKQ